MSDFKAKFTKFDFGRGRGGEEGREKSGRREGKREWEERERTWDGEGGKGKGKEEGERKKRRERKERGYSSPNFTSWRRHWSLYFICYVVPVKMFKTSDLQILLYWY